MIYKLNYLLLFSIYYLTIVSIILQSLALAHLAIRW